MWGFYLGNDYDISHDHDCFYRGGGGEAFVVSVDLLEFSDLKG